MAISEAAKAYIEYIRDFAAAALDAWQSGGTDQSGWQLADQVVRLLDQTELFLAAVCALADSEMIEAEVLLPDAVTGTFGVLQRLAELAPTLRDAAVKKEAEAICETKGVFCWRNIASVDRLQVAWTVVPEDEKAARGV